MTTKELNFILKILERIKNPSEKVGVAIAYVKKDLAVRDGQRDNFKGDYDEGSYW